MSSEKTVTDGNGYTAEELAQLKLPGYPVSRKGWYDRARRENWEIREEPGKGPGGVRQIFVPPPDVMNLIRSIKEAQDTFFPSGRTEEKRKHAPISAPDSGGGFIEVPWASAAAGHGQDNSGAVDRLCLREAWIRSVLGISPKRLGVITVNGDSMYPTLVHGEVVCVDTGVTEFKDDACYVINIGGFERIKRLQLLTSGHVLIKSDNENVEPEKLTLEEAQALKVIGMVLPVKLGFFKL